MPIYTFHNKETGEVFDKLMKYDDREQYLGQNPNLEILPGTASISDPVRIGMKKPDAGFRDVLKNIKSKHRGSNINTW